MAWDFYELQAEYFDLQDNYTDLVHADAEDELAASHAKPHIQAKGCLRDESNRHNAVKTQLAAATREALQEVMPDFDPDSESVAESESKKRRAMGLGVRR